MKRFFSKKNKNIYNFLLVFIVTLFLTGCGSQQNSNREFYPMNISAKTGNAVSAYSEKGKKFVDIEVDSAAPSKMVTYDVVTVGRSNPFMPYNEMIEYERARSAAISEANARNAQIRKIRSMQNYAIREQDDISPYSFNLPVPPTSLATGTVAAKITKTKVVGIMYNTKSPSAIINVDNKDYLVRPGDKIIGQEYKVVKITPNWVTAAMGSNVYSAAIGELFTKDGMQTNQTDIYKLEERFGGRKI